MPIIGKYTGAGAVALALFLFLAAPAWAQNAETKFLLDRITQLERQVADLSRQASQGNYKPGAVTTNGQAAPQDTTRIADLERQLRELTGQVEQANFKAMQATAELERLKSDYEVRFSQLEQGRAVASDMPVAPAAPAEDAAAPVETAANGTPEEVYNNAYAAYQRKEYSAAEKSFRQFLEANESHELAPNAQYWLGESYYARGNFKAASAVFAESYQKFPKASKAPDSLLKLGLSLSEQKRTKDACVVLRQLTKEYPSVSGTLATQTEQELKKLKCQ